MYSSIAFLNSLIKQSLKLRYRQVLPVTLEVFAPHERSRQHPVDVKRAVEMVDLVLQNAGIPAAGVNRHRLGALVQAIDSDGKRARHNGGEPGQAQASLEKFN